MKWQIGRPIHEHKKALAVIASLVLVGVAALLFMHRAESPGWTHAHQGPIIFISLDTLRADMLNAYGYRKFPTSPFLDSFAEENILFENCIVQEPRTLTSHMSLFTGLYPQYHKVQDDTPLPDGIPTLASILREAGYKTQGFVDNGWLKARWGFDRGFDEYQDSKTRGFKQILPEAVEWLEKHRETKFFLFLHTYDVHSKGMFPDYRSPAPFRDTFSKEMDSMWRTETSAEFGKIWKKRPRDLSASDKEYIQATYAESIRYVDESLRTFFDYLKESGIYDRALIIVWSDHGEGLLDHDAWAHNELFDQTLRVPLIMKIPGVRGGRRIRSLVSSVDLAPTILELVKGTSTAGVGMNGKSVMRFLRRENPDVLAFSLRTKGGARLFSVRSLTHHLFVDEQLNQSFYFDLREDPQELDNLQPPSGPEAALLQKKLRAWIDSYDHAQSAEPSEDSTLLDAETTKQLRALGYLQ